MTIRVVTEKTEWDRIIHSFSFWDVAHEWGYFEAYRAREMERASRQVLLVYEHDGNRVAYPFFLKPSDTGELTLEAIYGYTGALTSGDDLDRIWPNFQQGMRQYCIDNGVSVVWERFHPVLQNHRPLLPESAPELKRQVVLVQTTRDEDLLKSYRRKNVRKRIRLAREKGVVITRGGAERIDEALNVYEQTMRRNDADKVYYFEREFFEAVFERLPEQCTFFFAQVDGVVAAMSLALNSPHCAFQLLGGMDTDYRDYEPNYLLEHEVLEYYRAKGIAHLNNGGGRTGDSDDSLLFFKKGFTKDDPVDYYIGRTDVFL